MTWSLQDMATKYTTTRRVGARTDDANEELLGVTVSRMCMLKEHQNCMFLIFVFGSSDMVGMICFISGDKWQGSAIEESSMWYKLTDLPMASLKR